jgi:hypothetical protein
MTPILLISSNPTAPTHSMLPGSGSDEGGHRFVKQRGFMFWPIKNIHLPSLWTAVAGDRPVADARRSGTSPGAGKILLGLGWYYAKVLPKRATIISWMSPLLLCLSEVQL